MMGQKVTESSPTKPGPMLGTPGKTAHNHLRELLLRDFSQFLISCVGSLMPTNYWWSKSLHLVLREGRKPMTLENLHVLEPAFL